MKKITLNSYAKINLSLDVTDTRADGYHEVETYMQIIDLSDVIKLRWENFADRKKEKLTNEELETVSIELTSNKPNLPNDESNLAYKAAKLMINTYKEGHQGGKIKIHIKKRIPIAAGLAGGSGNAAAVILGINKLWGLGLNVNQMLALGEVLGADVPFCIMSQAHTNLCLGRKINKDPLATNAAIGKGIGTDLVPAPSLPAYVVLTKPKLDISTAEVYGGIDAEIEAAKVNGMEIKHPNTTIMARAIKRRNFNLLAGEMNNILEFYTLKRYPAVAILRQELANTHNPIKVMMSGSGPTLYGLYSNYHIALSAWARIKMKNATTYMVETL